jgi:hypothetical protein
MDLPEFRAGMRLMASELNRLADQVRASRVISFVGGTVNQGPGGVSLVANPFPSRTNGGTTQTCPFACFSLFSEDTGNTIAIPFGLIENRIPQGMNPDPSAPPFQLSVDTSGYVYSYITWDTETMTIVASPDAVGFVFSDLPLPSTDVLQYDLISIVFYDPAYVGDARITEIQNQCIQPVGDPCKLDWSAA